MNSINKTSSHKIRETFELIGLNRLLLDNLMNPVFDRTFIMIPMYYRVGGQ